MATQELKTPWRETSLFQNLREITEEGYNQMLEYEAAGGELDVYDKSAKKYFEKYWRRRKNNEKKYETDDFKISRKDGSIRRSLNSEAFFQDFAPNSRMYKKDNIP